MESATLLLDAPPATSWRGEVLALLPALAPEPLHIPSAARLSKALAVPEVSARMVAAAKRTPAGEASFASRWRLELDLEAFAALPEGTVGRAFVDHLEAAGIDPRHLLALPAEDDASYLRAHLWETHDLWHLATGFGTDPIGEYALQAFMLAQLPSPFSSTLLGLGLVQNALAETGPQDGLLAAMAEGHAMGLRAKPLFGFPWNRWWDRPLDALRAELELSSNP